MSAPRPEDVKRGIAVIWENLQCPICLDLMSKPVSTQCDHLFCKFCMMKLLERSKRKESSCPVCKVKVTKRSLQESPGFQKLIEGLQNLIQSYEFDTSTNYFTGDQQKRQGHSIETESQDQLCNSENTVLEDGMENHASLSSAAAKDAYAKLMGLEKPEQLSVKEASNKTQRHGNPPPRVDCSTVIHIDGTQGSGKRSRKKNKKISDKRQKKSLEKVSEWLLKNPSSSDSTTEGKEEASPVTTDTDEEPAVLPSVLARDVVNFHNKVGDVAGREGTARGLEEQVFGVVYRRERRTSTAKTRKQLSPQPCAQEDDMTRPRGNSSQESTSAEEAADPRDGVGFKKSQPNNSPLELTEELEDRLQEDNEDTVDKLEDTFVFEESLKRPGRRSKMKTWQAVDQDLLQSENLNTNCKRRSTRRCSETTNNLEQPKNCKYRKSLALVKVGTNDVDLPQTFPNPRLLKTEVTIESYPSSAEPKSPEPRQTRRSRRLQEITAEVQGPAKRRRSKVASPEPAPSVANQPVDEDTSEKNRQTPTKNGCVWNDDAENIVAEGSGDPAAVVMAECEGNVDENSLSFIPDTVDEEQQGAPSASPAVCTPSFIVATAPSSSLPEKLPKSPNTAADAPEVMLDPVSTAVEEDVDTNDSEVDTELLMKTFKGIKRKSFFLGSPSPQIESSKPEEQDDKNQAETCQDGDPGLKPMPEPSSQPSGDSGISKVPKDGEHEDFPKSSVCSESPALSPNQVAAGSSQYLNVNSAHFSQILSAIITPEEARVCRGDDATKFQSPRTSGVLKERSKTDLELHSSKSPGIPSHLESSVTPEGLVPINPVTSTNHGSDKKVDSGRVEIISQPCPRRKRRVQRLESTDSESSVDDNCLPSMAQIFSSHQNLPSASILGQTPEELGVKPSSYDEAQGQSGNPLNPPEHPPPEEEADPPCRNEWVTSSQGSVDLFATPEECGDGAGVVCVNTGISIDSTQYSSEILNTQQKEEMQQELRRLERMMALVSEALQKKESDESANQNEAEITKPPEPKCSMRNKSDTPSVTADVEDKKDSPKVPVVDVIEEKTLKDVPQEASLRKTSRMELVASGLSASELGLLKKFARKMDGCVSKEVTSSTTHVIIRTDQELVCERTLKYFQGIAGRKWVLSFLWITECFKQGKVLDKGAFEVCGDVVNGPDHNGPERARRTPDDHLLMKGYEICFQGSFTGMTTGQMEEMVEMCGATVIRDPLMFSRQGHHYQLVVVQPGSDDSQSYYTALQKKAAVVTRSWLLDSISTYTLQNPRDYKP